MGKKKIQRSVKLKEKELPSKRQVNELINFNSANKYVADYHCTHIERLMREGKSIAAVCVEFRITNTCFHQWLKRYPEFAGAYEFGLACAEKFWEEQAMDIIEGKNEVKAAPNMIRFMLERKFKKTYGNSVELTNGNSEKYESLSDEELDSKIKQLMHEIKIRDFTKKHIIDVTPKNIETTQ